MTKDLRQRLMQGSHERVFVIAEAGVNHNGRLSLAKQMVDKAKWAGADAVKFQLFKTEEVVTRLASKADYQKRSGEAATQFDMLKKLELSWKDMRAVSHYCRKKGILFLATAFDLESADRLGRHGVPIFKVGSGDLLHFPMLDRMASYRRPIILSTGMSTLNEIRRAVAFVRRKGVRDIVLLHCVSCYPTNPDQVHLRFMDTLQAATGCPVGWSDHTLGTAIALAAAGRGARVIEKHFTLSRSLRGPDHAASLEPQELRTMIRDIRIIERALGNDRKRMSVQEGKVAQVARRSIVARRDLPQGHRLSLLDLAYKRPAGGLSPELYARLEGKIMKLAALSDETLTRRHVSLS